MKLTYLIILSGFVMAGCRAFHGSGSPALTGNKLPLLQEAREALSAGEFYRARQITREVLKSEPNDRQAEQLMAEIIDQEIARQKEIFETKATEEFTPTEKSDAVKTWLERSQALLDLHQYDEALLAAEKVFLYDPENLEASRLIDQIKKKAYQEGKGESLVLKQMYEGEIQDRIKQYHQQAEAWIETGHWGAARLAVEKILLLAPEDREALKLYEQIKEHRKAQSK